MVSGKGDFTAIERRNSVGNTLPSRGGLRVPPTSTGMPSEVRSRLLPRIAFRNKNLEHALLAETAMVLSTGARRYVIGGAGSPARPVAESRNARTVKALVGVACRPALGGIRANAAMSLS
jgi:hypothetical protein